MMMAPIASQKLDAQMIRASSRHPIAMSSHRSASPTTRRKSGRWRSRAMREQIISLQSWLKRHGKRGSNSRGTSDSPTRVPMPPERLRRHLQVRARSQRLAPADSSMIG
jgi:hypothetical protein